MQATVHQSNRKLTSTYDRLTCCGVQPLQLMPTGTGADVKLIYREPITGFCFRVQFSPSVAFNHVV